MSVFFDLSGAHLQQILEAKGAPLEELAPYISGSASADGWNKGILNKGMYSGGQVVGRIHDVPTVAQLMERIINQAIDAKKALDALF